MWNIPLRVAPMSPPAPENSTYFFFEVFLPTVKLRGKLRYYSLYSWCKVEMYLVFRHYCNLFVTEATPEDSDHGNLWWHVKVVLNLWEQKKIIAELHKSIFSIRIFNQSWLPLSFIASVGLSRLILTSTSDDRIH